MQSRRAFSICLFLFCLISTLAVTQVYQVTDLGQLSPTAINGGGQVVGNQNGQASFWKQSAGPKGLGTLTGGTSSYAQSINDLGAIVGTADGPGTVVSPVSEYPNVQCDDLTQPFVWTTSSGMQGLGTAGTPGEVSIVYPSWCEYGFYGTGINDAGQVVGYTSGLPDFYQWAFLWTSAGGMTTFGSSWTGTFANGISSAAQIVGQNGVDGAFEVATSWNSGVSTDLGTLGGGYISSANGVNDQGQVVGWFNTAQCGFDDTDCPNSCSALGAEWGDNRFGDRSG
jgi:probable HAF family extracellular repeat protein